MNYLNEFTSEWWRGNENRRLASDYVTRISYAFTNCQTLYTGRIDGIPTDNQDKLQSLRLEIISGVFNFSI
jgi:phosphoserine phosphatase